MNIRIVTDSTCDLPSEILSRYKIIVIPMYIHIGNNSFRDGVSLSRDEFYEQLPNFNPLPVTAAPNPEDFRKVFLKLMEEGTDSIISIHISEKLSTTVNSARAAAIDFKDVSIQVIDSGQLSLGMGFLVEKAAQMVEGGFDTKEILSTLRELMARTYVFASLKTLDYLQRSGRMHFAVARLGDMLKIKPLLHMHQSNSVVSRARTQKRATEVLFDWLTKYAPFERIAIVHAGAKNEANFLYNKAKEHLPGEELLIAQITPVLGSHLGIGAMGFACISKKIISS